MARSLGDWWDHHAAVNMQTVPSRASPFGLRGQRFVAVAESRQQRAETRHDARRLVDRQLLLERHVQAHVQERVRLVGVIVVAIACQLRKDRVVLGVQQDHVEGQRLHADERLAGAIFAPGAQKKSRA